MQAGDVTLQFGGAHMTESPDSDDRFGQAGRFRFQEVVASQARKFFFGAREVQHRSERAIRSKVLRRGLASKASASELRCEGARFARGSLCLPPMWKPKSIYQ